MRTFLFLTSLVLAFFSAQSLAQCTKDVDCRVDRICDKGICVWPPAKPGVAPPLAPSQAAPVIPTFNDFRVEFLDRWFQIQIPSSGDAWLDDRFKVSGPVKPNFGGQYLILLASCGTGCRIYRLFDLTTSKEHMLPFSAEQQTKNGDGYTTSLEFEKDSTLIRAIYSMYLKSGGKECRQRFFSFRNGKLSSVSQITRTEHDFCR